MAGRAAPHQRYYDRPERSLVNVTLADMYWGRYEHILAERKKSSSSRWINDEKALRGRGYIFQKLQSD